MPPSGIRTRNPSKRETTDARFSLRGHCDRIVTVKLTTQFYNTVSITYSIIIPTTAHI